MTTSSLPSSTRAFGHEHEPAEQSAAVADDDHAARPRLELELVVDPDAMRNSGDTRCLTPDRM